MVGHTEVAYVIDPSGRVREEFEDDPGPGTSSTKASFAVLLANAARQYVGMVMTRPAAVYPAGRWRR